MITWMQRHKKWLIITIWISTIAFIGAGFVGWGQYSYGDKAGAIAKVGSVELTQGDLQKAYSNLYMQYNKMLQGNFDEAKAKELGLQKQAFRQLQQQALLLNLAKSYDLMVTDIELFNVIKSQKVFYKNGVFDKNTYKTVLSQNRMTPKEYEESLRKDLLIQKTLRLLPVKVSKTEEKIMGTLLSIADKINYKVLTEDDVTITVDDAKLQKFWEGIKNNFHTQKAYEIYLIKQEPLTKEYDDAAIKEYYTANRVHFRDSEGKILPLEDAKKVVIDEMNLHATKKAATYTYLKLKKGELSKDVKKEKRVITASDSKLPKEAMDKISSLSANKPYAKPVLIDGNYYVIELIKVIPAQVMSFAKAKALVLPLYKKQEAAQKMRELANKSFENFTNGKTSNFITIDSKESLQDLSAQESQEFLQKLFLSQKKRAFITLSSGKIVLYNILEQKLLTNTNTKEGKLIMNQLKNGLFSNGLIQLLQKKFPTEIYVEGL